MTRNQANRVLDRLRAGEDIAPHVVRQALIVCGDARPTMPERLRAARARRDESEHGGLPMFADSAARIIRRHRDDDAPIRGYAHIRVRPPGTWERDGAPGHVAAATWLDGLGGGA